MNEKERQLAKAEAYREAMAYCEPTPGLVLNRMNYLEFEKRARELEEQAASIQCVLGNDNCDLCKTL
jgi:hypothetical protein